MTCNSRADIMMMMMIIILIMMINILVLLKMLALVMTVAVVVMLVQWENFLKRQKLAGFKPHENSPGQDEHSKSSKLLSLPTGTKEVSTPCIAPQNGPLLKHPTETPSLVIQIMRREETRKEPVAWSIMGTGSTLHLRRSRCEACMYDVGQAMIDPVSMFSDSIGLARP